ncbi:MAG: UvrD/REP helicase [Actinomycetia bacterium]|nr:UvrD/REP helicase [Actinomycetes bacterium]
MTEQPTLFEDEDAVARHAIVTRLGDTLFVEAGAGSGKTTSLVARVYALVRSGVPMRQIAAITFTEKAAAELRDKVRQRLEQAERTEQNDLEAAALAGAALDELDGAAISTLHAFAQRLLSENPIEAGLPPGLDVSDEIGSQVAFEDRWSRWFDQILDDPALARSLLLLDNAGVPHRRLRDLAIACNDNWDLVADRMQEDVDDPPPLDVSFMVDGLDALCALRAECRDAEDLMVAQLDAFEEYATRLRNATDEFDQFNVLGEGPSFKLRRGRKDNWSSASCDLDEIRDRLKALGDERDRCRDKICETAARRLAVEIGRCTLVEAEERRRSGRLEFHDLLVLARRLLRDPEHGWDVRLRLRDRYTRLLLDEFQDTDPIQCDLAVLLASPDPAAAGKAWDQVAVEPGRLFVVGDPKQSIYRFRRADVHAFLTARSAFGGTPLHLTRNFRTTEPVIGFVNHVFHELIVYDPDSQPKYVALDAVRQPAPDGGPAVTLLGVDQHPIDTKAEVLRAAEAADVAATVHAAITNGWLVQRRDEHGERFEPCTLGDICVLLPARTSLGHLEDALDAIGVPYRAETSSLVYGTREIRDLLAVLAAIDDPTDELALVTALRTPLLGCGDDDLYTFKVEHRGRWNHQLDLPETLPATHPVAEALNALRVWHDERLWLTPSELIDRIVRERRLLELGFAKGRPRDLWRRVRFVIDQARAFSEARGGGLRDFLAWADLQSAEGARVVETVLPETDDDAVRILTIHGAKGLEFPITIVSGMTTRARNPQNSVRLVFPHDDNTWGLKISKQVMTEEFERYLPIDEQMDFHEKLRLLYVAATRAQDHLVMSVHRAERKSPQLDQTKWTHSELVWNAACNAPNWEALDETAAVLARVAVPTTPRPPLPSHDDWADARETALRRGSRPKVRAATSIAKEAAATRDPGLAKDARDLELPPWNKGRYGTAVGRAVHAVLQTINLATGAEIIDTARAQAAAEGVIGREDDIVALARSALGSAAVQAAVDSQFWRETYVATPVGEHTLEGYVDLIYRTNEGLVVVDYKTDALADNDLDHALDRYRLQGASYALAVAQATGEPVVRCVFVFLHKDGARERDVPDLSGAVEEVRRFLGSR